MAFALRLQESLERRYSKLEDEFAAGADLRTILDRYLMAVEAAADTDLVTSILLLDPAGQRLYHGAGPRLPQSYWGAIDGMEIGPDVGSCGTAAFLRRPIYVTDIETDPLWESFREIGRAHGLRACWSTPIFDTDDKVIGTFAIYHLTPRSPTPDEVQAIGMITEQVAEALMWSRSLEVRKAAETAPLEQLKWVRGRLGEYVVRLSQVSATESPAERTRRLEELASDCRELLATIRRIGTASNDE